MSQLNKAVYFSDSLGNDRSGGASLSGEVFLEFLAQHYDYVLVISAHRYTPHSRIGRGGGRIDALSSRAQKPMRTNAILIDVFRIVRWFMRSLGAVKPAGLLKRIDALETFDLYVNSFSPIYRSLPATLPRTRIKTCVVCGCPESIRWQEPHNPERALQDGITYLEQFDHLIFVSKICLERWQRLFRSEKSSFYLPNSIDEAAVRAAQQQPSDLFRERINPAGGSPLLVCVGSVQWRKGQDIVVQALPQLVELTPNLKVIFVGTVSRRFGGLEIVRRARESKYADHLHFVGHRSNVLEYVKAADMALFVSRAEAFPRSVAEYLAMGKVVLSSNASGVPEMIEDGVNGYLFEVDDIHSLVSAYRRAIEHSDHKELQRRARETYFRLFSKEKQMQKAEAILNSILASNSVDQ